MLPAVSKQVLVLLLLLLLSAGCSESQSAPEAVEVPSARATTAEAPADGARIAKVASRPNERPIPNFSGRTLDGKQISISSLIGKRLLIFFFNPETPSSKQVGLAVKNVAARRGDHNFEVLGVAIGSRASQASSFATELGLDFPIIDDSSGKITRMLNLRAPVTLLGVDSDGYFSFVVAHFDPVNAQSMAEERMLDELRIPAAKEESAGALSGRPMAPDFTATRLEGGAPYRFADVKGRPAVLIFFLHTCPHCHKALAFLKEQLAAIPEAQRPELIAISAVDRGSEITAALREEGVDFFPVLLDPEQRIQREYGVFSGFPDVLLINAKGEIVQRVRGWGGRDPALMRMQLAKISGTRVPMLLNPKGYTGSDVCGVCHSQEHDTWQFTAHATAFDTLVAHGADRNSECIGCHVVGFEQPGGFSVSDRAAHLEDVGCESCHGRGGPHLSPESAKQASYETVCIACHNREHSLGFDYETFLPSVSHKAIAALSKRERAELLAGGSRPGELLPTTASYTGSDSCESCHAAEFTTWLKSPHAATGQLLEDAGKGSESDCQACHTTGFDMPGGFVKGAEIEIGSDLSRVGCESCHGPGGDHVPEDAVKRGTILSLGDKCDTCVILKVCGSCHDRNNDPGFEFDVEAHIERQRHGTIEAGTGKKLEAHVPLGLASESRG